MIFISGTFEFPRLKKHTFTESYAIKKDIYILDTMTKTSPYNHIPNRAQERTRSNWIKLGYGFVDCGLSARGCLLKQFFEPIKENDNPKKFQLGQLPSFSQDFLFFGWEKMCGVQGWRVFNMMRWEPTGLPTEHPHGIYFWINIPIGRKEFTTTDWIVLSFISSRSCFSGYPHRYGSPFSLFLP